MYLDRFQCFHMFMLWMTLTAMQGLVCATQQTCNEHDRDCNVEDDQHISEGPAYKYMQGGNEHWSFRQQIYDAKRDFKPCAANCSCHYGQIKSDLKPYKGGISEQMVMEAWSRGTLYQLLDGEVYREEQCMFPSRCAGVEYFLHQVAEKVPNTELVINVRDWPQVASQHRSAAPPLFSFSKQVGLYGDILYPAWSFWEGGPAINLHPTGIGRWDIRRKTIIKASNKWKWSKKLDKAFFRGSRTSADRDGIVLLSREDPDLADAQYTKNQAWKSEKDTLNAPPAEEVSLEHHCQYKYLFNFHGVAASFRFKHLFLCGSVVFHEMDGWIEFFYPQMKPWIHYVPVPARPSTEQIRELIQFARAHDAEMREIARVGRDFMAERLRMSDITCYWKKLLKTYTNLLTYEPQRRDDVKLVPYKLH